MKLSTMNRVLAAVLALGMTAALAGCGSTASSEATAESAATEETAESSATEETAEVDESAYDYLADFSFSQAYDDNGYLKDVTALDYVTLPDDYADITIDADLGQVTDEDISNYIDQNVLSNYATDEKVTDRAADVCFGYGADGSQQLQEADSARFGGSGSGECRWIQAVKVDCQVNRHICLAQPIGQFLQTGEIELVNIGMAGGKLEFFPLAAADTELVDAAIAQKVMAAAQHTGMAELCAEIVIPQVGVSVKMNNVQVGVFFHGSPHSPQRDEMFTAQKQGQLAIPQDLCRAGFNIHQSAFAGAEAELQISAVKHVAVGQVFILIGAVGFQAIAFVADGGRAKACAGAVAGGGIERRAVQHNAGGTVAAVTADKVFYIAVRHQQSSTSRSISSKNAGR